MAGGFVAGFDVGGTNIRAEVLDGAGAPAAAGAERSATSTAPGGIVDTIVAMTGRIAERTGQAPAAVGVGCAGLVSLDGVVSTSPNIAGIADFPLREALAARLDCPVTVDNDATSALWAEFSHGAAAGASHAVLTAFGTGIGGGLIVDGELRRGAGGLAGEAGHMIVAPGGPPCPCGRRGCWERLASGAALGRAAQEAARGGHAPALLEAVEGRSEDLRGEHVAALAVAGDPPARALLRELAGWVAVGLNNLILVLSPEVVVLGGGLSELGEVFMAPVREALADVYVELHRRPPVALRAAHFGDRAGAVGAALLAARAVS